MYVKKYHAVQITVRCPSIFTASKWLSPVHKICDHTCLTCYDSGKKNCMCALSMS